MAHRTRRRAVKRQQREREKEHRESPMRWILVKKNAEDQCDFLRLLDRILCNSMHCMVLPSGCTVEVVRPTSTKSAKRRLSKLRYHHGKVAHTEKANETH
jgi:hypothetical protein